MKPNSAELKAMARQTLTGYYGLLIGAAIVTNLLTTAIRIPFPTPSLDYNRLLNSDAFAYLQSYWISPKMIIALIAGFLIGMLATVLEAGFSRMHLMLAEGKRPEFTELFYGFTVRPDRFLIAYLILAPLMFVGIVPYLLFALIMIPFIILSPAIALTFLLIELGLLFLGLAWIFWISLNFGLVSLLLTDHPDMKTLEAFRQSYRLMKGNKGRLFYINLSFIGWMLLCVLSCGIGLLWFMPYMRQTIVYFYRDIATAVKKEEFSAPVY